MNYAKVNKENICTDILQVSAAIQCDGMIEIENYDSSLLGKKYDNGEWVEVPQEEPELQPTEEDLLNAQILLNQAEQDAKLKEIDEALALLLLNQQGGIQDVL